jgi:PKD repeat protein
VTHRYSRNGSFNVTLTVSNTRGNSDRTSQFVNVGASARPTAQFSFSPVNPQVNQSVFFNASASVATPGRTLVDYSWTFGDGGSGSGVTTSHRYRALGTYTVTLTVTDDLGKTGTATQTIALGADLLPTADFTFSPTNPAVGAEVSFDARLSTPVSGRTNTNWDWAFGDGNTAVGERVTHRYFTAGTYSVTLTVRDSAGGRRSIAKEITVQ